jgi:hypothetical protein
MFDFRSKDVKWKTSFYEIQLKPIFDILLEQKPDLHLMVDLTSEPDTYFDLMKKHPGRICLGGGGRSVDFVISHRLLSLVFPSPSLLQSPSLPQSPSLFPSPSLLQSPLLVTVLLNVTNKVNKNNPHVSEGRGRTGKGRETESSPEKTQSSPK